MLAANLAATLCVSWALHQCECRPARAQTAAHAPQCEQGSARHDQLDDDPLKPAADAPMMTPCDGSHDSAGHGGTPGQQPGSGSKGCSASAAVHDHVQAAEPASSSPQQQQTATAASGPLGEAGAAGVPVGSGQQQQAAAAPPLHLNEPAAATIAAHGVVAPSVGGEPWGLGALDGVWEGEGAEAVAAAVAGVADNDDTCDVQLIQVGRGVGEVGAPGLHRSGCC